VNTPPPLDPKLLGDALRVHWDFEAASLDYLAVGFGSHHWSATDGGGGRRFVTVDDLSKPRFGDQPRENLRALERAFQSARALRDGGLDFVVAALPAGDGALLEVVTDAFSVAVFPWLEGASHEHGEYESDSEREAVRERIGRLHGATALVEGIAGREDFALPGRAILELALAEIGTEWRGGPYSEPARAALAARAEPVREALAGYDRLVSEVRARDEPWVITHGEPHRANVIWTSEGPQLIDWDTALVAPAARDLWMLRPPRAGEDVALSVYRLWWDLAEIAIYVEGFRGPHSDSEDMKVAWRGLRHSLRLAAFEMLGGGRPIGSRPDGERS
jgi:spectinomycin phosphotransferase